MALVPVLLALLVAAGCGSSGSGSSTGATSGGSSGSVSHRLEAVLASTPYRPWFRSCMEKQISRRVASADPAELSKLDRIDDADFERQAGELFFVIGEACNQPGRKYIEPHASEAELRLLRKSQETGVGSMMRTRGIPGHYARCIEAGVDDLSPAELLVLLQGFMESRQAKFEELGRRCS
jgi:hypothetical protein